MNPIDNDLKELSPHCQCNWHTAWWPIKLSICRACSGCLEISANQALKERESVISRTKEKLQREWEMMHEKKYNEYIREQESIYSSTTIRVLGGLAFLTTGTMILEKFFH